MGFGRRSGRSRGSEPRATTALVDDGGDKARVAFTARAGKAGDHEVRVGEMRAKLVVDSRRSAPPVSPENPIDGAR